MRRYIFIDDKEKHRGELKLDSFLSIVKEIKIATENIKIGLNVFYQLSNIVLHYKINFRTFPLLHD